MVRGVLFSPGPVFFSALLLFLNALFISCAGTQDLVREMPLPVRVPPAEAPVAARPSGSGGTADEIRSLVEAGTPSSLTRALELIRSRGLENGEFGRIMAAVSGSLIQKLYPDLQVSLPARDPPQTHGYTRILKEGERGVYTAPAANSTDYLEWVLPFLAFFSETRPVPSQDLLSNLLKAEEFNPASVLAPLFLGFFYERKGRPGEAGLAYEQAFRISGDCYPAVLGLARIKSAEGQEQEAIRLLSDLVIRYPDNMTAKRQLARAYYRGRDWSRAEPAIAEVLQRDSRNGEFILMRARTLVEQGQFLQAQAPLDVYAAIDPNDRLYLFLRARVQAEGYRNRDAALNYLRSLLRSTAAGNVDDEALIYAVRLFLESPRGEDQQEGRELLQGLLNVDHPSLVVLSLALQDTIRREAWREGRNYLNQILSERRSSQDLLNAYKLERGLGNNASALSFARELYEREPSNEEGCIAYVTALIDTGRQEEAGRIIETRLAGAAGGTVKSRYYYLRSRIRTNEDTVMNDLRSALFEEPRNLSALIAMFEIYHRRRDERRAVYYLKQALALAPENSLLRRYEQEYAAALGAAPGTGPSE
jgi:tetratricopeptide (TPR) repeat protein